VARVLHHAALCTRDIHRALTFYRDGLGLEVFMDQEFSGDRPTLFDARGDRLRSIFLGDPARADAGVVELVAFPDGMAVGQVAPEPATGFFLLSFFVDDVEATIDRLRELGVTDEARRIEVPGPSAPVQMATVRDPDGVLVELIGGAA
jgi:catechol 2,3-dioxygenase-like lactoylglutathione lyase family enzyme